jgi:hypothetical protein
MKDLLLGCMVVCRLCRYGPTTKISEAPNISAQACFPHVGKENNSRCCCAVSNRVNEPVVEGKYLSERPGPRLATHCDVCAIGDAQPKMQRRAQRPWPSVWDERRSWLQPKNRDDSLDALNGVAF